MSTRLDGLHVLFVDDRRDARFVVDHILRDAGAAVSLAEDGVQALSMIATTSEVDTRAYDVVVMDVAMPGLDGLSATRHLRQLGFHHPILALTAGNMELDRQECLEAGCDEYQSKPIDGFNLVNAIYRLSRKSCELSDALKLS
ncbi:MAG TPA: response regulator [Planctomicrobium sp.]|nr:response regulator [Planctomicrobium sp.]